MEEGNFELNYGYKNISKYVNKEYHKLYKFMIPFRTGNYNIFKTCQY